MKINFKARCHVPMETIERNVAHCKTLNLPEVSEKVRPPLAVIGGGHSVVNHVEELRKWRGDVWASGSAFPWAISQGINASYYCIDPGYCEFHRGAKHAILATCSDPKTFGELNGTVEVFSLVSEKDRANHCNSSVTAVPELAIRMGHRDISFFGFDSSLTDRKSHLYMDVPVSMRMRVVCNGESFETIPSLLIQAEFMVKAFKLLPDVLKNRSGGFLAALMNDDYDITHFDNVLMEELQRRAA